MPIFSSSSHVQITGGNFVDIGGDFNLQSIQPPGSDNEALTGPDFRAGQDSNPHLLEAERSGRAGGRRTIPDGLGQESGRHLVGADRAERHGGARMLPYDVGQRRRIMSPSHDSTTALISSSSYYPGRNRQLERPRSSTADGSGDEGLLEGRYGPHSTAVTRRAVHPSSDPPRSAFLPLRTSLDQDRDPFHSSLASPPNLQLPLLNHYFDRAGITPSDHSADVDMGPSNFSQDPIGPTPGTQQMAIGSAFPWDRPIDAPVTNITGGTFIDGNVIQRHGEAGLHILHRAIAGDAFHDSAERYPQPRCHPETRTKLLDVLGSWARGVEPPSNWTDDPEALESSIRPKASRMRPRLLFSSKMFSENNSNDGDSVYSSSRSSSEDDEEEDESLRSSQDENISLGAETSSSGILWLHGPAGSGKSAIAQSFCERLQEQGLLGGSFFFKRGDPSRGSAKKIFPTLAYQLAIRLPEIRQLISQTVENDPAIVDRSLSTQLQELIIEPCRRSSVYFRLTIVIDGLDECDGQNIQAEVLRSIGNAVYQGNLPVLFFIASRPESHICETFSGPSLADLHRPLNITQSFEDIRTYFVDEFGRIYREHRTTMAKVPFPWPTSGILDGLVNKSSGYFIYASTVIKFVDDKQFRPVERLDIILGIKNSISTAPFDPLDQLYHQILSGVPTELRPQLLGILAVIASNLRAELTIEGIEQLLELETGDVRLILQRLHSVIGIPEDDGYPHLWVYHASFIDFLDSPLRSAEFCVRSSQSRTNLACQILKVFSLLDHSLDITRELAKPISFLGSPNAFRWITSADPSPDLLPLVLSLNPDFVFDNVNKQDAGMVMLDWLKKFNPVPEELIQLWHEYTFMALCNQAWTGTQWTNEQPSDIIHNILAQTSSQLIRILTAYRLLAVDRHYIVGNLFRIHVFLGVSWEELRAAICPLRNLLGDDEARLRQVVKAVTSGRSFGQVNSNSLFLALAKGSLRFTQVEKDRETPPRGWLMNMATGWGHFLRSCPPSPDLLQEAGKFEFKGVYHSDGAIKDYHNAIQWLKTFPEPPFGLIDQFKHCLEAAIEDRPKAFLIRSKKKTDYTFDFLEKKWFDWREGCKRCLELPNPGVS